MTKVLGHTDPIDPALVRVFAAFTRWLCRQWPIRGPRGASCSGYAWNLEQRGRLWGCFWRKRIDGAFLFWRGQQDHCEKAWSKDLLSATGADLDRLLSFDVMARNHQTAAVLTKAIITPSNPYRDDMRDGAPVVPYFVAEDDVQEGAPLWPL